MGYFFDTFMNPQLSSGKDEFVSENTSNIFLINYSFHKGSKSLGDLYNRINDLTARNDLKLLLRKCIYSIMIDEDANEEVKFLNEVKNLLNQVKDTSNMDHEQIISLIEDIYMCAVDKKIDENARVDEEYKIPINDELIGLFQSSNIYNELTSEIEEESQIEDDNDEEEMSFEDAEEPCEYHRSQLPTPERDADEIPEN